MNLSIICCNAQIHYSQTTLQTCASQGKVLRAPPEIRGSDSQCLRLVVTVLERHKGALTNDLAREAGNFENQNSYSMQAIRS